MEDLLLKLLETGGIPLLMLIIGFLAAKYIKPWAHANEERLARLTEIAEIADEITDGLLLLYPEAKWDDWLDQAVDKIIKQAGLSNEDVAKSAVLAAIARKTKSTTLT